MRFLPTEAEVKLLRQYERERQPLDELAAEDRFMLLFSKVERLTQRMAGMAFLGNFQDNLQMLTPVRPPPESGSSTATPAPVLSPAPSGWPRPIPASAYAALRLAFQQLNAIIAASASVKSSQKLKQMLEVGRGCGCGRPGSWAWVGEGARGPSLTSSRASSGQIILALGNYMNSSKRGAVYGFKLQSLDLVRRWGQPGARKPEQPRCSAPSHHPLPPFPAAGHQVH